MRTVPNDSLSRRIPVGFHAAVVPNKEQQGEETLFIGDELTFLILKRKLIDLKLY